MSMYIKKLWNTEDISLLNIFHHFTCTEMKTVECFEYGNTLVVLKYMLTSESSSEGSLWCCDTCARYLALPKVPKGSGQTALALILPYCLVLDAADKS